MKQLKSNNLKKQNLQPDSNRIRHIEQNKINNKNQSLNKYNHEAQQSDYRDVQENNKNQQNSKFCDVSYNRIAQIREKYRNQTPRENQNSTNNQNIKFPQQQTNNSKNRIGKIKTRRILSDANTNIIDFFKPFDPNTFRFENPTLNQYFNKLTERKPSQGPIVPNRIQKQNKKDLIQSQIIVNRIESRQVSQVIKLYTPQQQQQQSIIKSINKESKEQLNKVMPVTIIKQNIVPKIKKEQPTQQVRKQVYKLSQDVNSFALMLQHQMKLDIQFRKMRELIPKAELENISKRIQKINPKITKQKLMIQNCEINHFQDKKQKKIVLSNDELILEIMKAFECSESFFHQYVLQKTPSKVIQRWLEVIDIDKNGIITIGNILTDINTRTGISYRNRDIIRLASRITDKKQFTKEELANVFASKK